MDESAPIVELGDVLECVRRIAAGRDWERVRWDDAELHALLEVLLSRIRMATGRTLAKVPFDLGRLPRTIPQRAARVDEGALLVAKTDRIDINSLTRPGIVLVDGSVHVGFLARSLVVARGAVDIGFSGASVVIAGQHVGIGHECHFGVTASAGASVLLSGTSIDVSHADGTVLGAADGVVFSHARQVSLLDSSDTRLVLRRSPQPDNPLARLVELEEVAPRHCEIGKGTVIVRFKNRRDEKAFAREGQCLVDASGRPVSALENWRLAFTATRYTLWRDGTGFAELHTLPSSSGTTEPAP